MKTVLIVDDEPKIVQIARDYLENAGFTVLAANSGETALVSIRNHTIDLIVLDLGLPDMDGLDVCRKVRRNSNVPIVMLTARDEEADKLVGLELGADDYVTKPFSPKELVARVRAVFRWKRVVRRQDCRLDAWLEGGSTERSERIPKATDFAFVALHVCCLALSGTCPLANHG